MKFRKNMFLEVSTQRISGIEFSKHTILNRVVNIAKENSYCRDIPNIEDFKIDIKNKNLYVLVEGEAVYIKKVVLPVVKKYLIYDMIKSELRYYYKNINNIAFTYKLIKKDKFNMEILVFCIKGNSLDILENSITNNIHLKKVNLIQFCFKNYYASKINVKNYIFIFYYKCDLYFLICCDNEIVANNIINIKELPSFSFPNVMTEFLELYNDYAKLCEKIYYSNIKDLDIKEFEYINLPNRILEDVDREELLKYIIVKG
jgi:hypothetical protein